MINGNQTVGEWLEERRKSVEDLSLQIIGQKQERIDELEKENKKLKKENKKLKAELELKNLALKQAQEGSILI